MSWRCRLGFHQWRPDHDAARAYMDEHAVSILGWPSGSIPQFCERCGTKAWV